MHRSVACLALAIVLASAANVRSGTPIGPARRASAALPLTFERNLGQAPPQAQFLSRGPHHGVLLRDGSAVLIFRRVEVQRRDAHGDPGLSPRGTRTLLGLRLLGAASGPRAIAESPVVTRSNYFIGADPSRWLRNVENFVGVRYVSAWPGVDVSFHDAGGALEQDFHLAPGTSPSIVRVALDGAKSAVVDATGDLVVRMDSGSIRLRRPVAWQEVEGARKPVRVTFVVAASDGGAPAFGFDVGERDASLPLVIDPVVSYSTYLGGTDSDRAQDVAVDATGAAFVCGSTESLDFPLQDPFQPTNAGGGNNFIDGDAFVTKLSPAGDAALFSTYLGGSRVPGASGGDSAFGVALDATGNVYLGGATESRSFPTTPGAYQAAHGGAGGSAGFVAKLDPTGSNLVYSTYLGGYPSGSAVPDVWDIIFYDRVRGIAVDATGNAHVAGGTQSSAFPTTPLAPQTTLAGECDAFVSILDAAGASLLFSTYVGGPFDDDARAIALSPTGRDTIAGLARAGFPTTLGSFQPASGGGVDGFVAEIDRLGGALAWSTYFGGKGLDQVESLAIDSTGAIVVAGSASSADFPVLSAFQPVKVAAWEGFAAKLLPGGAGLAWSTWLGGRGMDFAHDVALDGSGRAVVVGETTSLDYPLQDSSPLHVLCNDNYGGCGMDAFVTVLQTDGAQLCYSELFGGEDWDWAQGVAVGPGNDVFVAGMAREGLATSTGALQESLDPSDGASAFVLRLTAFACP